MKSLNEETLSTSKYEDEAWRKREVTTDPERTKGYGSHQKSIEKTILESRRKRWETL